MTAKRPLIILLVAVMIATSCNGTDQSENDPLEAETWTLEEDLRIDEEEDYFLGRPLGMDVDGDGAMFIADLAENHIKVVSHEGHLVETIGRLGEGPGEFQRPRDVHLARGDSVFVLSGHDRITVFEPHDKQYVRTFNIDREAGFGQPVELHVTDDAYVLQGLNLSQEGGADAKTIYKISKDERAHEWVQIPQYGPQNYRISSNGNIMMGRVPFTKQMHFTIGPERRIHHGINDTLAITISELDGTEVNSWSLPVSPAKVTPQDIDEVLKDREPEIRNAIEELQLSPTHPLFYNIVVDDKGRTWLKRQSALEDSEEFEQSVPWWIVDTDGELLAEVHLNDHVDVIKIQEEYVYGIKRNPDAIPAVIRYTIHE